MLTIVSIVDYVFPNVEMFKTSIFQEEQ